MAGVASVHATHTQQNPEKRDRKKRERRRSIQSQSGAEESPVLAESLCSLAVSG